ncbi:MAG: hypothetical protein M3Q03_00580 [Chloroflexota bacterium]|nr:hypothetical protein [Chloroflexota bacterium]
MTPRDRSTTFEAGGASWRSVTVDGHRVPSAAAADLLGVVILFVLLGAYLIAG